MAICCVSRSAGKTSGNLYAYCNGKEDKRYWYSFENRQWKSEPLIQISRHEWEILNLSKQGLKGEKIAEIIGITHQHLRNTLTLLYEKLDVENTMQAVILAQNHLIVVKQDNEHFEDKIPRKSMTPEMIQRIQEALDSGKCVNSIANEEDISECNIRYYLKIGKLNKPQIRKLIQNDS